MRLRTAALVALLAMPVSAQEHRHADGSVYTDRVGAFYATWLRPELREQATGRRLHSCCNRNDCMQVQKIRKDGKWFARGHKFGYGQDVFIRDELIESSQPDPRDSPDGFSHACILPSGLPLCATLGTNG